MMFVDNLQGVLMSVTPKELTGNEYEIWFPYTKKSINTIREGTMLAVRNFASKDDVEYLSVLQVTSVMPMHYALGNDRSGYPGFVEEATVSAAKDWQQETPREETTKIKCMASPSYIEIRIPSVLHGKTEDPSIENESNIPMIGERVRLLDSEWTGKMVNKGLTSLTDRTITLGRLAALPDVSVLALWEEMVQTHYGIFAYTKAGKSNLVSTCTSKILEKAGSAKVIVFDVMSEYTALLIDALCITKDACIVACRPETVPGSVVKYWSDPSEQNLQQAAEDIVNTTLLPKFLKSYQQLLVEPVKFLLKSNKIRLYSETRNIGELIKEAKDEVLSGASGNLKARWSLFIDDLARRTEKTPLSRDALDQAIRDIDQWIENPPQIGGGQPAQATLTGQSGRSGAARGSGVTASIRESAEQLKRLLEGEKSSLSGTESIKSEFMIKLSEMISSLNSEKSSSLFVIQSNRDEDLRNLAFSLGNIMLYTRRTSGRISPLVSFVFDEADMFIPGGTDDSDGIGRSRYIAEQLARRGRKYGLGIAIATQRIVYLHTNVLGQPHTYFVSKLPRQSDRQRIQDAFGLSETAMQQTLRFEKGQWLLVSDDATGMEGVPIPVTVPDANVRVLDFLKTFKDKFP